MRGKPRRVCLFLAVLLMFGCGNAAIPQEAAVETPVITPVPAETPFEELVVDVRPQETTLPTLPPTPTPMPTPTPTPTPTPSPTPVPTPFGILWLPDTQGLAYAHPEKLKALGAEIAARKAPENLIAVVHTGDIVDNGFKAWEWDNFDLCLSAFADVLPFYPLAGNHDLGVNLQKFSAYLNRPFLKLLPEEQIYEGGKMHYALLRGGDVDLLLLCVSWECGRSQAEREWIDAVFERYPDMPCILATHGFLKPDGTVFPKSRYLENNIVAKYPSVRLVICGHSRQSSMAAHTYDDDGDGTPDRTVNMLMLNRQSSSYAYRVLLFDPVSRSLEVRTYAIGKSDMLEKDENWPLTFTINNAF